MRHLMPVKIYVHLSVGATRNVSPLIVAYWMSYVVGLAGIAKVLKVYTCMW
jgi:hypothetical protein